MQNADNITPIKRATIAALETLIETITNDITEDELAEFIVKLRPDIHGYIKQDMFVNSDQGMKILNMKDRNKFFALMKEFGIKNQKLSRQSVGFLKSEVEAILPIVEQRRKEKAKKADFK